MVGGHTGQARQLRLVRAEEGRPVGAADVLYDGHTGVVRRRGEGLVDELGHLSK